MTGGSRKLGDIGRNPVLARIKPCGAGQQEETDMAKIVVVGAGIGGMSAAYELRAELGKGHEITLVGQGPEFGFTPSNPWLAVGWRERDAITLPVADAVS